MRPLWRSLVRVWWLTVYVLALGWAVGPLPTQAQGGCIDLLLDGGFESGGVWVLGPTDLMPRYETYTQHSGNYALALGITKGGNAKSYSSARQLVTIPVDAASVSLSFWVYAMADGAPTTDYMELVLLTPSGTVWDKPWYSFDDSRTWNLKTFDLTAWRGETVQIYFNVYNDGLGGTAGMFLDDVALTVCPATTVTPTGTPTSIPSGTPTASATASATAPATAPATASATPGQTTTPTHTTTPIYIGSPASSQTPTATPSATSTPTYTFTPEGAPSETPAWPASYCVQLIQNGDFENDLAFWQHASAPLMVQGVTSPVHDGAWALRLGSEDENATGHSAVFQYVRVPAGATEVTLVFWGYTWAGRDMGADYAELALLSRYGGLIHPLWRESDNRRAWVPHTFSLPAYAGREIGVYFNVFNDGYGGSSAMYLDDVSLRACGPYPLYREPVSDPGAPGYPTRRPEPFPTAARPVVTRRVPTVSVIVLATASVTSSPAPVTPAFTRIALAMTPELTRTPSPAFTPVASATPISDRNWLSRNWETAIARRSSGPIFLTAAVVTVIALLVGWFIGTGRRR